jgi:hypothetical protein
MTGARVIRPVGTIILAACLVAASGAVAAGDVCVACDGPAASYRCQLAAPQGLERSGYSGRVAQYVCVTELAKHGGHASCSVRKDGFSTCLGELRIISLTGAVPESPQSPQAAAVEAAKPSAAPAGAKSEPPRTMVELAKRTSEASKQELQNTGRAVTGAMKKTWDCLATFFSQC